MPLFILSLDGNIMTCKIFNPAIQKCALHSIYSPMRQQKSTFNSYNLFCNTYTKHGKCVLNCTKFAFYTIKMSAQEYLRKVEKTVLSGQPSLEFADQVAAVVLDQTFIKTFN